MKRLIRVLLADDHPLIRAGIREMLAGADGITLVGEATNGYETQSLCQTLQPDVVLLDLNMPGPQPHETIAYLQEHCPTTDVLILTAHDEDIYVRNLMATGVTGYVLKDQMPERLVGAIRGVTDE
jgi:DNA-binding NarL/FixJ family response regulator